MIPLPHTLQGMKKKSDMFDSNVLGQKSTKMEEKIFFPFNEVITFGFTRWHFLYFIKVVK